VKTAVLGAAGYAGGELLRLLHGHPAVKSVIATSRSQAGKKLGEVHPQLAGITDATFQGLTPVEAAQKAEVVFLALEHGESGKVVPELLTLGPKLIIDIAADFRTSDRALYEQYYGKHPAPELLPKFTYALADVLGQSLRGKTTLAAPGCFATAAQLALWPLRNIEGVAPSVFAITGSSGAGVGLKPTVHHPARAHNLFAYSVLSHRHEAEILQRWHEWAPADRNEPRLMVHAGPFVRGIYLTLHARGEGLSAGMYHKAYLGRPFVKVLEQPPELTHVVGTNHAYLHAAATPDGKEIVVHVAIDNLVKGAGGQAVQAMNLALGLPETAGLVGGGIWPV
jgi:N-acetyl-gamma-glutamyl-phosphate reductase common form